MKKGILCLLLLTIFAPSLIPVTYASLERCVLIVDGHGDALEVEATNDETWAHLIQLFQQFQSGQAQMYLIGGVVEAYDNEWGFRFDPNTIATPEYVAEILMANIAQISENLGYWLGGYAFASAYVVEAYRSPDITGDGVVNRVDLTLVSMFYGYNNSELGWVYEKVNLNYDFGVDLRDMYIIGKHYGETAG